MQRMALSENRSEPLTGEIVSRDIGVRAYANPLRDEYIEAQFPSGLTIAEIIGGDTLPAICIADGRIIEADEWCVVRPLERLEIRRIPASGDTGRIIGSIAILALAVWAGPALAGYYGLAAGWGAVFTAAIGITGTLLMNQLIPPASLPSGGGNSAAPLSFLTSSNNAVAQFAPIPVPYGRMRYYPPIPMTALPYTELVGSDQYFRAMFILGYGPLQLAGRSTAAGLITHTSSPTVASAIRIGGTTIDQFDDVEYEIGTADQVSLYTGSIVETAPNVSMPQTGTASAQTWVADGDTYTQTTAPDTDEVSIDLYFPALFSVNGDNGKIRSAGVRFKVEARRIDTSPIGAWTTLVAQWEINNTSRAPVRLGRRWKLAATGQYDIRVTRTSTYINKTDGNSWYADAVWTSFRSIKRNVKPFDVPNVLVMAMRIRANDQLGGRLDRVSIEATRILPVWNTTVSPHAWVNTATRNPAWAYVDVLTGNATRNPLAKSKIDVDAIKAWADWCDTETLYCDTVIDAAGTVFDRARDVASAGLGSWHVGDDGSVSIVRDVVSDSRLLVSPRNSAEFGHEYDYPTIPHALRVQFVDPDRWEPTERLVYADGYDPATSPHTTPTRYEQLPLFGVTDADQAWKMGRYHLAQLTLRPERYQWSQDIAHLVYSRGDCVDLHHDVILVGLRAGRIASIDSSPALTATVDELLPMELASPENVYALRIQRSDGTIITRTITTVPGGTTSVTFSSAADGVQAGDHFIFGISGSETIKAKITRIEPQGGFKARVSAVPAADNIYDAWTGSIPAFDAVIVAPVDTDRTPPETPTIVDVIADTSTAVRDSAGELRVRMAVTYQMPSASVSGTDVEVRIRDLDYDESTSPRTVVYSEWRLAGRAPAGVGIMYVDGVEEEVSYQVQARAVRGSLSSPWTASADYTIPDFAQITVDEAWTLASLSVPGIDLRDATVSDSEGPAYDSIAAWKLDYDSYVYHGYPTTGSFSYFQQYRWLNFSAPEDYDFRATEVSSSGTATKTGTTGSWSNIASDKALFITQTASGQSQWVLDMEIRRASDLVVVASCRVTLNTDKG
jgi:hypothetical protein